MLVNLEKKKKKREFIFSKDPRSVLKQLEVVRSRKKEQKKKENDDYDDDVEWPFRTCVNFQASGRPKRKMMMMMLNNVLEPVLVFKQQNTKK